MPATRPPASQPAQPRPEAHREHRTHDAPAREPLRASPDAGIQPAGGERKTFAELGLAAPLLRALAEAEYDTPTPIQARAIPHLLQGRDLLGIAQTGTGKTAAFALPILQYLAEGERAKPRLPRALVLSPTRELSAQIHESFERYGRHLGLRYTVIFGGVGQAPQVQALARGIDVLVATPGRLLDLLHQRCVSLRDVEVFVLDEADRMLDMGFIHDVKKVIAQLPQERQSLLFSATMPDDVAALARGILHDPLRVEVTPQATTAEKVAQRVVFVEKADKPRALFALLDDPSIARALVFTRTKHGADKVARLLRKQNHAAEAIHGNKSQSARVRALDGFRDGEIPILVATDIAARGIDVPGITHVINYDVPNVPESYVHRIGRTARAGESGMAISLCGSDEREFLRDIEKIIRAKIPTLEDGARASDAPRVSAAPVAAPAPRAAHAAPRSGPAEPREGRRRRRGGRGRATRS